MKQPSETVNIQLHVSLVIPSNSKSYKKWVNTDDENADAVIVFEQPSNYFPCTDLEYDM